MNICRSCNRQLKNCPTEFSSKGFQAVTCTLNDDANMNKVIGILFAIRCFATSALSQSMMGAGMWFLVIIATGCLVAVSQFFPRLKGPGSGLALLLGLISLCAILLGLLAATIGGSFNMDDSSALLLFLFFLIAVFGIILASMFKKPIRPKSGINAEQIKILKH